MEKNIVPTDVDIIVKAEDGLIIFELKEPRKVSRAVLTAIKEDISNYSNGAIIIYPDQQIINSEIVYAEDNSRVI